MSDTKVEKGYNQIAFTNPRWMAGLEKKEVNLALVCEAIDFREVDREFEDKKFPVGLNCSILVNPKHMSKRYKEDAKKSTGGDTIFDLASYGGGVPATDFLEGIEGSAHSKVKSEESSDARWFKDIDDALKYADDVYKPNSDAMFMMIGFKLDRSVNRIGTSGWDIIKSQVTGKHWMDEMRKK